MVSPVRTGVLRLGTRGSLLARSQAAAVADALQLVAGCPVELVEVSTAGDRSAAPVARLGATGVFVSALRDRLVAADLDLAVHSYKDLPTAPATGLVIGAVPVREDPRDALVAAGGRRLADLPAGARIGTGAPRRVAQLRALRRGLVPVPVRGNVDTRLARVAAGDLDAVVVARAGLVRIGRLAAVTEVLDPDLLLPAPAQGALAVECRADDARLLQWLAGIDDAPSRAAVTAERALLAALQAGCTAPVAGLADIRTGADRVGAGVRGTAEVSLRGSVTALDGSAAVTGTATGPIDQAAAIGRRLAADLIAAGATRLLQEPA